VPLAFSRFGAERGQFADFVAMRARRAAASVEAWRARASD
jgi:hypothetical protein